MHWVRELLIFADGKSFASIWFWLTLGVTWFVVIRHPFSISNELIFQARHFGASARMSVEVLAEMRAKKLLTCNLWKVASFGFSGSIVFVFGWVYQIEFAQALFLWIVPVMCVGCVSLYTAYEVQSRAQKGEALLDALERHRLIVNFIGISTLGFIVYWTPTTSSFQGI
ncbi:MAG: hypothetical protein OXC63_09740 [Aestuariivita sp.]|nr:hypothetical protein [Aestuariivita sp.]